LRLTRFEGNFQGFVVLISYKQLILMAFNGWTQ
jgi:hypothetical protein